MNTVPNETTAAKRRIFIAGGTGLVGRELAQAWLDRGAEVVVSSRSNRPPGAGIEYVQWNPATESAPASDLARCDIVYNLIGETIGASRWSRAKRQTLLKSRVESTNKIVAALGDRTTTFINASAVSAYPGDGIEYAEAAPVPLPADPSFITAMTSAWEDAARRADPSIRTVIARIGIVIASNGMLTGVVPLFRMRIGRFLGSPDTPVPWIDIRDLASCLVHLAGITDTGSFNLVGPYTPTFREFSEVVQTELQRRSWFGLPALLVRAALGKHAAELVLARHNVRPGRVIASGFVFEHTNLAASVQHALST